MFSVQQIQNKDYLAQANIKLLYFLHVLVSHYIVWIWKIYKTLHFLLCFPDIIYKSISIKIKLLFRKLYKMYWNFWSKYWTANYSEHPINDDTQYLLETITIFKTNSKFLTLAKCNHLFYINNEDHLKIYGEY